MTRIAILAEGAFERRHAKKAIGLLRYRRPEIVCVIDSAHAGRDAFSCVGEGRGVPVVSSLAEARLLGVDQLAIGIALAGGGDVPAAFYPILEKALRAGIDVVNGLHTRLGEDPRMIRAAAKGGARIVDCANPRPDLPVGGHRRHRAGAVVVLTVGTDAAVGKMTVSLELVGELRARGVSAAFVATGQTGIMIAGSGISVDAVVADFVSGAAEELVVRAAESADYVIVEGQGSLTHPGFSGVTLGLLHGSAPDELMLVHDFARRVVKGFDELPLRPLREYLPIYEDAAAWSRPAGAQRVQIVAVALNSYGLDEQAARAAATTAAHETGLPATDAVPYGAGVIADAVLLTR
ncbi:MAG: hypothetical protein AUH85_05135 [Chloroflexi bacterium 13_1_40CM_4_68_4]|nr:MAG: hypothetical protein AUH85_05135 [Chloroflexi bacterium 13_1_40CM_4_68_4]